MDIFLNFTCFILIHYEQWYLSNNVFFYQYMSQLVGKMTYR